jgi:vibriolysin
LLLLALFAAAISLRAQQQSPEQRAAITRLGPQIRAEFDHKGVPAFLEGKLSARAASDPVAAAAKALNSHRDAFRAGMNDDFAFSGRKEKDQLGQDHVRMQQTFHGLPVVGGELIVHMTRDSVIGISGRFVPDINVPTQATLSAEVLKQIALQRIADNVGQNALVESVGSPVVFVDEGDNASLAVPVQISYVGTQGAQIDDIYVDANAGYVVGVRPRVMRAKVRKLYDAHQSCSVLPGSYMFGEGGTSSDPVAVAAYNNTGKTYDFYKAVFNRDSYDNAGATIVSSVHFRFGGDTVCDPNNSAWFDTYRQIAFGDGDEGFFSPLARALDITAHELTHAVTARTAALAYLKESGALNESMSDAMGESAECWTKGTCDWEIGESVYTPTIANDALRYLYDPAKDTVSSDFYPTRQYASGCTPADNNDYCGVHANAGIGNLAYYLLAHGGKHPRGKTNINVAGVGIDKAEHIWYRALTVYMTSATNFAGARTATAHAAADLYGGSCSSVWQSVQHAWDAVGVPGTWSCAQPVSGCTASSATTVIICQPAAGATVASPVHLVANGGGSVDFMEVWSGGTKRYQTAGNKVDTTVSLPSGTETITVIGKVGPAVTDKKSVTFTVGSTVTCAQPSTSYAAVICSPVDGSTVGSPVTLSARGGSAVIVLEGWVDGVKVAQANGTTLYHSMALGAGSHRFTVYSHTSTGLSDKRVSYFTVR